jgi:hypothetical protein
MLLLRSKGETAIFGLKSMEVISKIPIEFLLYYGKYGAKKRRTDTK